MTEKQRKTLAKQQARMVGQTMKTPGWEIIENAILLTKSNAEAERRLKMKAQTTRELALYYCGVVDGAEQARANIYGIIDDAQDLDNEESPQTED